jgi:hypothetical protein
MLQPNLASNRSPLRSRSRSRRASAVLDRALHTNPIIESLEARRLLTGNTAAVFTVNTANDDGTGYSLRQAIADSNNNPGVTNTIKFGIPGGGVQTISLLSNLPAITVSVTIDGTTESGYTNTPLIQLQRDPKGSAVDGLDLNFTDTLIKGLSIGGFTGAGVRITQPGNTLQSNYIGLDASGSALPNLDGVVITAGGNIIGVAGSGNVISGNTQDGIHIIGADVAADGNSIVANSIGTTANGSAALHNLYGIVLDNVANTTISGNTVAGNNSDAITFNNSNGGGNVVKANKIGVVIGADANGVTTTSALGNQGNGISINSSSYILIGGPRSNGNIIAASSGNGIQLDGSSNINIGGNFIGVDGAASTTTDSNTLPLGNTNGIELLNNSHDNTLGATVLPGGGVVDGNVIGGNTNGIQIGAGNQLETGSANNSILGNFIGTDPNAAIALSNFGNGIQTSLVGTTVSSNGIQAIVPGTTISGNTIAASFGYGIYLIGTATVQGNFIGAPDGSPASLDNQDDGIRIISSGNVIGGPSAGAANTIANNQGDGINVRTGTQNTIQGNSIYSNLNLGISLDIKAHPNDPNPTVRGARTGANNLQNRPDLGTATVGNMFTISGALVPNAAVNYTIDFYSNITPDAAGVVQGRTYLGSIQVSTATLDADGNIAFTATLPNPGNSGNLITATATDSASNTSEFSTSVTANVATPTLGTSTILSTTTPSAAVGKPVTFTATTNFRGPTPPTGAITFYDNTNGAMIPLTGTFSQQGNTATLTTSSLGIGVHTIIAVTAADSRYAASTSDPLTETITNDKVTISGVTFRDITGDGLSGDDNALPNVTVKLFRGSINSTPIFTTTSGTDGSYSFGNLPAGQYFVQEVTPANYVRTAPALSTYYSITAKTGQVSMHNDFDNYMTCNDRQWVTGIAFNINGCNTWIPDLRGHIHEGDKVKVRFCVAAGHTATLSLVSYTAPGSSFDASKPYLQSVYQFATGVFTSGCHTMQVTIPQSYFQVDFVCGDYIDHFGPANSNVFYSAQNRLISADNGGYHKELLGITGQDVSVLNT